MNQDFIEDNVIIVSKQTIDEFLKQENPADLIALYTFYYYTAKWQKTNQPKCTDNYTKVGLHWGNNRLQKAKDKLIQLKLINVITKRDDKGIIEGWYVKLNYIWKQETPQNAQNILLDTQNAQNPQVVESTSGKQETNALSAVSINALSANKENVLPKKEKDMASFEYYQLTEIFFNDLMALVNPPCYKTKKPNLENWSKSIRLLHEQDGIEYNNMRPVWQWAFEQPFWQGNLLSTDKFRKHYNTLFINMKNSKPKEEPKAPPSINLTKLRKEREALMNIQGE